MASVHLVVPKRDGHVRINAFGEVKTVHEHGRTSVRFADTNTYDDPGDVTLWREVKD